MKKRLAILLISVLAMGLIACSNGNDEQTAEHAHDHDHEYTQTVVANLRIGLTAHDGEPAYEAAELFAKQVEVKSEGAIKATVYGDGQLGGTTELLAYLANNENRVDIVIADVADLARYDSNIDISKMPFLFKDYDQVRDFMNSDIQQEAGKGLEGNNMRALAYYSGGFHCLIMKEQLVSSANDLQGLTIATSKQGMSETGIRALGARTQVLNLEETRQALQQGYCDGYEGNLTRISENRIYQGQEYLIVTNHSYVAQGVVISETVWQGLDQEYQEIIEEAAVSSAHTNLDLMRQQENQILSDIESAGVRIQYPMANTFWQKAEAVTRGYSSQYAGLTDKVILWKNGQR